MRIKVDIEEHLIRTVEVEVDSEQEALATVEQEYKNGKHVLDASDYAETTFRLTNHGLKAVDIKWDVDDPKDLEDLPTEIDIPGDIDPDDDDAISDYISDFTGFCHKGFDLQRDEPNQPAKDNRVTVVVSGGRVSEAYASDPNLIVDVLDQDTDDSEAAADIREATEELDAEVQAGTLFSVLAD